MIRNLAIWCGDESVPLPESFHRILARDVHADVDIPGFTRSVVDGRYVVFYLVCGAAAALGQAAIAPSSTVPMVGASGAIAGVLGAYLVWFPWSRIHTFVFLGIFSTTAELPAPLFLIIWLLIQFFSGALSLASAGPVGGGVAFFAHIGGFVAGAALAWWLRRAGRVHPFTRDRLISLGGFRV